MTPEQLIFLLPGLVKRRTAMKYVVLVICLVLLVSCVPIPAEPPPEPVPASLDSAVEAGLIDLASTFARSDGQADITEYADVLLGIRDCVSDDVGEATDFGLKTAAGHTGFISYTVGVLLSSVMFQRAEAVEEGELESYWSGDRDEYSLIHLKWTLAYCQDTGEYEWLKTE